ncbi:Deoxyribonuclease-2 [Caenorhabditis elegans]|uniref:Deoxyribonuclease-2 n=1 Tax=Caenorhabditis elegans TaxID=6239 RepID=NUC1_CAEEL|nr:Deoxyribonuclease-2 [Caenorhabditis elegans]Q17778.1 RecName: Full=Deoxyribonuclease-2; AltName: Full=Deoxyribonuclease II; Short=DNase II; Flags: Precursor [Caenorhabditis elegans]CAA86412.1 Deoxyribonuclease-2 [Caenorhabditis elegans]|eukprot:NP_509604.1 Deoxyribonuclease-2 [Caenorhabditis elegans]
MGLSPAAVLIFLLLGVSQTYAAFSCKDQSGNDVDWFAVYKMPIEKDDGSVTGLAGGVAWYYVDVNKKGTLTPSAKTLDDNDQAIAYTLQQYYDKQNDKTIFHVMYNDEPWGSKSTSGIKLEEILSNRVYSNYTHEDDSTSTAFGHTKGTIFFDGTSGVWLVHSVPLFPNPTKYEYPVSGHDYGQTMLCMTFKYAQLKSIGTQLFFNRPNIYSSNLPTNMAADNADLAKAIAGQYQKGQPFQSVIELETMAGYSFTNFAKSKEFNADLYDTLVAPTLKTDLVVETWRRGSEIPLDCKLTYHANDALSIHVGSTTAFSYTKDHSKMAHSADMTKPWVCIGDINRMTSQYVRGGGTTCISSSFLWKAYSVIATQNNCA